MLLLLLAGVVCVEWKIDGDFVRHREEDERFCEEVVRHAL